MNNLSKFRNQKGYSQERVAEYLGITSQAYCNYENDKREASYEVLLQLAELYETSIDELLGRNKSDEISEYLDQLRNRSEMRMLFSVAKGATKEEIEQAVIIIEALRKNG